MFDTQHTSAEACNAAGISYRQLDYWTRSGYVTPVGGNATPGSGARRRWTTQHVAVLAVLAKVSGVVAISRLGQLAAILHDLPLRHWGDITLLVDRDGGVWLPDADEPAPPVTVHVALGQLLPEQLRVPAASGALA